MNVKKKRRKKNHNNEASCSGRTKIKTAGNFLERIILAHSVFVLFVSSTDKSLSFQKHEKEKKTREGSVLPQSNRMPAGNLVRNNAVDREFVEALDRRNEGTSYIAPSSPATHSPNDVSSKAVSSKAVSSKDVSVNTRDAFSNPPQSLRGDEMKPLLACPRVADAIKTCPRVVSFIFSTILDEEEFVGC